MSINGFQKPYEKIAGSSYQRQTRIKIAVLFSGFLIMVPIHCFPCLELLFNLCVAWCGHPEARLSPRYLIQLDLEETVLREQSLCSGRDSLHSSPVLRVLQISCSQAIGFIQRRTKYNQGAFHTAIGNIKAISTITINSDLNKSVSRLIHPLPQESDRTDAHLTAEWITCHTCVRYIPAPMGGGGNQEISRRHHKYHTHRHRQGDSRVSINAECLALMCYFYS